MKIRYFYSMSEYENIKSLFDFDIADFVIENNKICVDFTTECKKAKTAVKRLFKAINNSKYNELFDGWEESILESMENGIYRQYEENEFAWSVTEFDDVFYIYIKFFNYKPTKNDTTYTVTRFYYPHGIEGESMETTVKEFDTLEKAIKHAHRYAKGIRFAGVWIENQSLELVYEITSDFEAIDHTENPIKIYQ